MRGPWRMDYGLWVVTGLLLANGLAALLLLLPVYEERTRQETQALDLERRMRTLQREGRSSEHFLAAFREVEEFGKSYPSRTELVGLLGRMTKLARSFSLDIPQVDYRPSELKDAGLVKVTVQMGVEGTYSKIRRFLYELGDMRQQMVIERVTLRDPRGTSNIQVQLQLALYLR
jgi:Tfp pilus assembly protein PilO